jgi:hypothetical protein
MIKVEVFADPDPRTGTGVKKALIELGATSPQKGVVYARRDGRGPAVGLPISFLDNFKEGFLRFLDRTLIPEISELNAISFRITDEPGWVEWVKGESGQVWKFETSAGRKASDEGSLIKATLDRGFSKAGKWHEKAPFKDLSKYGLDPKAKNLLLTLEIKYWKDRRKRVRAEAVLYISKKGPTGEHLYARWRKGDLPKGDLVFAIDRSTVDNLRKLCKLARGD